MQVVIQQQQVIIDKLLAHTVKLEERVAVLEGRLEWASHVTSILQEQLSAKSDELEMYSRRPCIVLTELSKEGKEDFNKLKKDFFVFLSEAGMNI